MCMHIKNWFVLDLVGDFMEIFFSLFKVFDE